MTKTRALIVDDDDINVAFLEMMLMQEGITQIRQSSFRGYMKISNK